MRKYVLTLTSYVLIFAWLGCASKHQKTKSYKIEDDTISVDNISDTNNFTPKYLDTIDPYAKDLDTINLKSIGIYEKAGFLPLDSHSEWTIRGISGNAKYTVFTNSISDSLILRNNLTNETKTFAYQPQRFEGAERLIPSNDGNYVWDSYYGEYTTNVIEYNLKSGEIGHKYINTEISSGSFIPILDETLFVIGSQVKDSAHIEVFDRNWLIRNQWSYNGYFLNIESLHDSLIEVTIRKCSGKLKLILFNSNLDELYSKEYRQTNGLYEILDASRSTVHLAKYNKSSVKLEIVNPLNKRTIKVCESLNSDLHFSSLNYVHSGTASFLLYNNSTLAGQYFLKSIELSNCHSDLNSNGIVFSELYSTDLLQYKKKFVIKELFKKLLTR